MSDDTVRWGVTITLNGKRERAYMHNKLFSSMSRQAAMSWASAYTDLDQARIVKLTRKKKPRVAARLEFICSAQCALAGGEATDWLKDRPSKRVRITLEELAK